MFMCCRISFGLAVQQHDIIFECNNAISLLQKVVELTEIAFQARALFLVVGVG